MTNETGSLVFVAAVTTLTIAAGGSLLALSFMWATSGSLASQHRETTDNGKTVIACQYRVWDDSIVTHRMLDEPGARCPPYGNWMRP